MATHNPDFSSEDLYLNRAKIIMKFLGVWVPPIEESLLQKSYKLFMLALQYLFLIFQTKFIVQIWGNLAEVSQPMYLLFTQACLCLKITLFHVKIDNVRYLLGRMNSKVFMPQSLVHEKILGTTAASIKRFLLMFLISALMTCTLWAVMPFIEGVRKFPFQMWMPVSPQASPQFELGFVFQYVTILLSANMYFGVDSVALSMVIFGCAQIDIIKDKIMSVSSLPYGLATEIRKKILTENYKKLIECVDQHQAVVMFTQLVEDTYHWYLLFQLTGGVGLTCMCAVRITSEDADSMQIISIMAYLFVMMCQLFICCWCGHELTATNEDLHTVMYKCLWYEQDVKFKRDFCFAMMRTRRPLVLRAGHYISMSRQTFVAVLRMSYSYFAVLNQTNH